MNMNIKHLSFIACLFLLCATLFTAASALPVAIERVEIDDIELSPTAQNRLSIERDQEVLVEIQFRSTVDVDDVELEAFFSGYEYNDVEPLASRTTPFDIDAGVTYVKRLPIRLTSDVEEDDYLLRILFTNRFDPLPLMASFPLKLDVPRHRLDIEDIFFSPSNHVQAGSALIATVRMENKGEKDQTDVRVELSIPSLGVSAVDYVDEIETEEEEETEEMFLRIPNTAKSGTYDAVIEVVYDESHRRFTKTVPVTVAGDPRYDDSITDGGAKGKAGTVVTVGSLLETAQAGSQTPAVFSLSVENNARQSRSYTLRLETQDWADVTVTPSTTTVIGAGDSKMYTVSVSPKSTATAGAHTLSATLLEGNKTLKEVQFTVNVKEGARTLTGVKRALQIILVALLILLVIITAVTILRKKDEENTEPQTYY